MSQERVFAVDLARGLAVVFMIWVHVLITYSTPEVQHSLFGAVIGFLGSPPAAPVFMTLMGLSFYYSRNNDMISTIKRGFYIIALGYVLNFLRGVLPVFMVKQLAPSAAAGIPAAVADYSAAFLELDILHFAGLALIVMAVLRELRVNKYIFLVLAAIVAVLSPLFWGLATQIPVVDHFLDFLWGNKPSIEPCIGNFVSFPFFPWFAFPLVGMFLGDTLIKSSNIRLSFQYIGISGFVILCVSAIFIASNFSYHINDYYHSRPGFVLFVVGIVLTWLYICQFIVENVKMNWVFAVLFDWSKNTNSIYIIQWVLIMAGADAVMGFYKCSHLMTVVVMIFMMTASHLTNRLYLRYKAQGIHGLSGNKG